ncbi:hypothetical protein VaNZ11_006364, partial [Volvox africanus]
MDASGQTKTIRVAVRVRPLLPSDGATEHSLLQLDPGRPNEVVLASGNDRRTARHYTFDQVLSSDVTQEVLYDKVGVSDMVAAVVEGYHSTIFAYGQTGSGKTYTMEGYRYVSPSHGSVTAGKPAAGSAGVRGGAARTAAATAAPQADFTATPDEQLGLVPRAVRELFAAIARDHRRRFQIRCSFVQIYREQVYDLLNPSTLSGLPGGCSNGPRRPGSTSGPLRMRWSHQEGFYLDNLLMPEVESAEEAATAFQMGIGNKVMSSHRLNASSSRSHCIFTLYVASSPLESPLEQRTAKFTLVDLAGSERSAHTGATEGALREESVAINKSLFTLRQVITALTDAAVTATTTTPATAAAAGAAPTPHVPYRDSKLTCLLKHSLGGSSLTLMVACLSPADRFLEENASTLDYAARARKIANQVAVNEDPRSRLIRELRAEVTFLRQQLEATGVAAGAAAALPATSKRLFGGGGGVSTLAAITGTTAAEPPPAPAPAPAPAAAASTGSGGTGVFGDEDEAAYANQLRSADVEVLVRAVIEASRVALASSSALTSLRAAYARTCASLESLRVEYDTLALEDAHVRDRLSMLEALVAADSRGGGAAVRPVGQPRLDVGGVGEAGGLYTASTAALIELEELRRENALLHERLQLLEPDIGPSGVVLTVKTRGSVGTMGMRPATGTATRGGAAGSAARSVNARSGGGVRPATSGTGSIGTVGTASVRHQQTQRAQSAGSLLPNRSGRLVATPLVGTGASAAAAAVSSNPFVPNDVLSAVLPPPPPPTAAGGKTGVSGRMASSPRSQTNAGSNSSSLNKTMTVDQLRNVLQLNGGGSGST